MNKRILSIMLCIMFLLPSMLVNASTVVFSDLPRSHWAYDAVMDMIGKGIIDGFEDGTFRPDDAITREQFAKILVLAMKCELVNPSTPTFADVARDDWSYRYVEAVKQYLTGYKNEDKLLFKGKDNAVREDMAVAIVTIKGLDTQTPDLSLLNQFSDKESISPNLRGYVAISIKNKLMEGDGSLFNPPGTLT